MSEFRATMFQALPLTGAKPEVIASAKQFVEKLVQGSLSGDSAPVASEPVAAPPSEPDEIDGFLEDLDLNEPLLSSTAKGSPSQLRAEMHAYVRDIASKWSKDKPFFVHRCIVNPMVLLIPTSVGTDKATGEKTNLHCAVGNTKVNNLGVDHLVFENDNAVVESYDHIDGRTYYVRAFHIRTGSVVRLWISEQNQTTKAWTQFNDRRVTLDASVPHGCTISR
jgi:hypothetical protein